MEGTVNHTEQKPLTVFKASAGSGKTFTLAAEYIKLLILNPTAYRNTLAVTFTNKATEEMKTRIIEQLDTIAKKKIYKTDKATGEQIYDDFFAKLVSYNDIKEAGFNDEAICENAKKALTNILHDYSRFRIMTIDSFFQTVVRELAHELDLTANLKVDLNDNEALSEAVTSIIDEMEDNDANFDIVREFVEDKMKANKGNWRINKEVEAFGHNIFNEEYIEKGSDLRKKIADTKFLKDYKSKLYAIKNAALNSVKEVGEAFISVCEENSYDSSSFAYGESGIYGFFHKLSTDILPEISSRIVTCSEDPKKWVRSGNKDASLADLVEHSLHPILVKFLDKYPNIRRQINTVDAILKNINHLMLLNVINNKVRELNADANRFLLADTAHLLHELINDNDIPFIYEKMGARFDHIMIDEFQDTSRMQWENFKPLLKNALDAGSSCLIVGDVKQSIYRWRGGDWQILNHISDGDMKDYVNPKNLDTNFRSYGNIIRFNNAFFEGAQELLNNDFKKIHDGMASEDLTKAYNKESASQKVVEKKDNKGFVCIRSVAKDNDDDEETSDSDPMLTQLADTIKVLMDNGVEQSSITLIIRKNKYIPVICKYFNTHKETVDVTVVSDEAFRLDFSSTITMIITAMRYMSDTTDKFSLACLAFNYQKYVKHNYEIDNDINRLFLAPEEEIVSMLPTEFTDKIYEFTFLPLLELVENLYDVLELKNIEAQDAYLFFFHDQLASYCEDNKTDLHTFLKFWDEELCSKTIPRSTANGIQITSIHKSKGLQYHTVIMPYCDWKTAGKYSDILWCQPKEEPFSELSLAPVQFENKLNDSIFDDDYQDAVLKNDVDNLNLIYVGFTRAEKNLVILTGEDKTKDDSDDDKGSKKKKNSAKKENDKSITSITDLVLKAMPHDTKDIKMEAAGNDDIDTWYVGDIVPTNENGDKEKENDENAIPVRFQFFNTAVNYRQSNSSAKFINEAADEEDGNAEGSEQSFVDRGLLYHRIFEEIKSTDDIDAAIDTAIETIDAMGCFENTAIREEAARDIKKALQNEQARSWFASKWTVRNECAIVKKATNSDGSVEIKRPDRVIFNPETKETIVIDYKTGAKNNKKYDKQVKHYMESLCEMGYKNVKGYLWYVLEDKIEEVK